MRIPAHVESAGRGAMGRDLSAARAALQGRGRELQTGPGSDKVCKMILIREIGPSKRTSFSGVIDGSKLLQAAVSRGDRHRRGRHVVGRLRASWQKELRREGEYGPG